MGSVVDSWENHQNVAGGFPVAMFDDTGWFVSSKKRVRSGKHTKNNGKSPFSIAMFVVTDNSTNLFGL